MSYVWDGLCLAGAACVVTGLWWVWPPLGLVALGGVLVAVGWIGASVTARKRRGRR